LKRPGNERSKDKTREAEADPPLLDRIEVCFTPADRQTNDYPVSHATNSSPNSIVDQDILPTIFFILTFAKVLVERVPDLVQDFGHTSIDLPSQISPDDSEVMDESIARSRSEPFKAEDLVLCF
jgi:hypothetical protein